MKWRLDTIDGRPSAVADTERYRMELLGVYRDGQIKYQVAVFRKEGQYKWMLVDAIRPYTEYNLTAAKLSAVLSCFTDTVKRAVCRRRF